MPQPAGNFRIIARLDVKMDTLIKGIHLEGWRKVGDPGAFAQRYYDQGIDEIVYMDAVASLYNRNNLAEVLTHTAKEVFIPITVGGGIRSLEDADVLLNAGADKIAINTAATKTPRLISEISNRFGSQCVVLSIEAKKDDRTGSWEALTDLGREHTGLDVLDWAQQACELGAGEILLTSVDQDGTRRGFDVELTRAVADAVPVPVIASGGMGTADHLAAVAFDGHANAAAIASLFHFDKDDPVSIRAAALELGIPVRAI